MKPLQIRDRVRWKPEVLVQSEDIATIVGIDIKYQGTPLEHIIYTLKFDQGVFKNPLYHQIYKLCVNENGVEKLSKEE